MNLGTMWSSYKPVKQISKYRNKIRRQTATKYEEMRYHGLTGHDPESVSRETEEQRKSRLEKNRARTARKRKMETEEETSRRQEADRIRAKLRRRVWTDDNAKERQELQSRLHDLSKRKSVSGRWKPETYSEAMTRLDRDMFRKRDRRAKEKEQKASSLIREEQNRRTEKLDAEKQKRKKKCIDQLQAVEDKIAKIRTEFCKAKEAATSSVCLADCKQRLHDLERDSIQYYQELVELAQCDGFAVPREMRPSFITTPPLDIYTTKWLGTIEFEWIPGKQTWARRRKRHREWDGTTRITGIPRTSQIVIESDWIYDDDPEKGRWQERLKRVLEPSTSDFEPKRALTEYEWKTNHDNDWEWIPRYRRLIDSDVSLDHYAEFDWLERPKIYGDEGGHWSRRLDMAVMKHSEDLNRLPDTNAAPGTFDPYLFRARPFYDSHSLPHCGYKEDLTVKF